MKVIVTGATGMIGKGVLLECLDHIQITEVLHIGRRSLNLEHPKLKELIHKDFSDFSSAQARLTGYDACYHCMGVSAASFSKEDYYKMTYGFTMALAKTMLQVNPKMVFIYVSGQGTDSKEKGTGWAAVKGKTENDILKLGFAQAYMFRPGAIIPKRGVQPSSKLYKRFIGVLGGVLWLAKKLAPNHVVDTTEIGQAMINVTLAGSDERVLEPPIILQASRLKA